MAVPETQSLVLHVEASWTSPWVCSVFVVLREKAIPFETSIAMVRKGVGAIAHLHEMSMTGTAPVLQHGSLWLAESLAIVEYLEDVFPEPPMLPRDVGDRARARQIMMWMRVDHEPLRLERPSERMIYKRDRELPRLSPRARAAADSLVQAAERLGAGPQGWLFGNAFGVIDVELAFALMRLVSSGIDIPTRLRAYVDAVWARPSVREFVEHWRPPNPPDGL